MPSPFPGMDPYLEAPSLWPDVHAQLMTGLADLLGPRLRPNYFARVEERVYVEDLDDPGRATRVPDVAVPARREAPRPAAPEPARRRPAPADEGGAVALAVEVGADDEPAPEVAPIEALTAGQIEVRERYLAIHDRDRREVVAVIELLSPANKVGEAGRESFERKRVEVMASACHRVEIDLLRAGGRLVEVPGGLPDCQYLVHVSESGRRPRGTLWPIRLNQRLPTVPVPLRPGDAAVPLELPAVLASAYERAGYDLQLDDRAEPDPPLDPRWAAGADRLLRKRGLRAERAGA